MDETDERILVAVIDCIIPADDFPSASQAGVMNYLRRQLAGDCAASLPSWNAGLEQIDQLARQTHAAAFTELSFEQQTSLLQTIEKSPFFLDMVQLTSEGYYADPGNGGNAGEVSWKMVGFEPRERGDLR